MLRSLGQSLLHAGIRQPRTRARVAPVSPFSKVSRVVVYAIAAVAFALPLATPETVVSAGLGAALGSLLGRPVAKTRLRLPLILLMSVVGVLGALLLQSFFLKLVGLASVMGARKALIVANVMFFGLGSLSAAVGLRAASARHRLWAFAEIVFVSASFARLVLDHRYGATHRPFFIADPILAKGGDPALALLAIGVLATLVIMALLISDSSLARIALHIGTLAAVLLLLVTTVRLPAPDLPKDGIGLRNESKKAGEAGGRSQQREQGSSSSEKRASPPVAVVLMHDDFDPPNGTLYFRQNALSQFNGQRLVQSTRSDVDEDVFDQFPAAKEKVPGERRTWGARTRVNTTVALLADHPQPFVLISPQSIQPAQNADPGRFRRMYNAESSVLAFDRLELLGHSKGNPRWSDAEWQHYLAGPVDARYAELAQRLTGELPDYLRSDPLAQTFAITGWLGEQGTYSLAKRGEGAAEEVASFLFGDRVGYCVHFAHAVTLLARSLGIPARVATGYAVSNSSRRGGSALILSDHDAHAWAEVFLEDIGWVVTDVTPQTVLDPPPPPPDADLQRMLGQMARGQVATASGASLSVPQVTHWLRAVLRGTGYVLLLALLAFIVALYFIKGWRRVAPRFAKGPDVPRLLYRRELDRLGEVNQLRRFGETPQAFAERLSGHCPTFVKLTRMHLRVAFGLGSGEHGAGAITSKQSWQAANTSRGQLQASTSGWRRALGVLTPWSWIRSR